MTIDISSGEPVFSTHSVTHTVIDGVIQDGVPYMTFGAAIYDTDGNLYVGGNAGDHDMDNSTANSGGIYRVIFDETSGTATLELVAAAPTSSSNDGADDPRALSPFVEVDLTSSVLIRDLRLVATGEGELSYDDSLYGEGGADMLDGGLGEDLGVGGSLGDEIHGDAEDDDLSGGSGDDSLMGGVGDDTISGGSGQDALIGGVGEDSLNGGSGNDTLSGGEENDKLKGGSGDDVLSGGEGRDHLNGGSGDDQLSGGDGRDKIYLGAGADIATGGADADRFVFRSEDLDGSTDRITDFSILEGDRLDFRSLGLLDGGETFDSWFEDNVGYDNTGSVTVELEGSLLVLEGMEITNQQDLLGVQDCFLL